MEKQVPAIVVVSSANAEALQQTFLRYAAEYRVETAHGLAESLGLIQRLLAGQTPIAMVVAEHSLPDAGGLVTLDCLRALSPTSKRVLMASWDDWSLAREELGEAKATGRIDLGAVIPRGPRDEELHASFTDLLSDWGWTSGSPIVAMVKVITPGPDLEVNRIADFLDRQGIPHHRFAPDSPHAAEVFDELGVDPEQAEYPLVKIQSMPVMVRPTLSELAAPMQQPGRFESEVFDLVIVGAGPAGLGAAVYGASEGLSTAVVDADAIGGQAGSSSMIRNYLGFPNGISGMRLTQRARFQASRFGALLQAAMPVKRLELGDPRTDGHVLHTPRGEVRARSIVIATGVKYRRLGVDSIEELVGLGVNYGAAASAARDCVGCDAYVVGGGNSAGQAAMHVSRFARSVTILIRRADLRETMSDYLIKEIAANPRITVRANSEVVDGGGNGRLEWLKLRNNLTGAQEKVGAGALFLLLGANPHCDWLPAEIQRDEHGFVHTGNDVAKAYWINGVPPEALTTSVPGVFAAGDVRAGSMKRVAAASGEGAAVVPLVHRYLASLAD